MPFLSVYLHLVWGTKNRQPFLDERTGGLVERSLRATRAKEKVFIHAVGWMPDHVHVAVSLPATLTISELAGKLKGSSSHLVRHHTEAGNPDFRWQPEYGAVSYGEKHLPIVVDYILNQRHRHSGPDVWSKLELYEGGQESNAVGQDAEE